MMQSVDGLIYFRDVFSGAVFFAGRRNAFASEMAEYERAGRFHQVKSPLAFIVPVVKGHKTITNLPGRVAKAG